MLVLCLALPYLAMSLADTLVRKLGRTGADIVGRISGVMLAEFAVQFVFNRLQQATFLGRQAP